jgi:hypothetical protein
LYPPPGEQNAEHEVQEWEEERGFTICATVTM